MYTCILCIFCGKFSCHSKKSSKLAMILKTQWILIPAFLVGQIETFGCHNLVPKMFHNSHIFEGSKVHAGVLGNHHHFLLFCHRFYQVIMSLRIEECILNDERLQKCEGPCLSQPQLHQQEVFVL